MLLSLALVTSVQAADLEAKLFGETFQPVTKIGITEPDSPGRLTILLADEKFSCADAIAEQEAESQEKREGTVMIVQFGVVETGMVAEQVLALGGGIAGFGGTAKLGKVPTKVGKKGTVVLDLIPAPGGPKDSDNHAKGTVSFELCSKVAKRPSLASTKFVTGDVDIVQKSLFEGRDPITLAITIPVPEGWTQGSNRRGSPQWKAPDGVTTMDLLLFSGSEKFVESCAEQAASQVDAFDTEGTESESLRAEAVGKASYVSHWRKRWGDGPWLHSSDVFRYEQGWEHAVKCSLNGSALSATEVFEAGTEACLALTKR